MAHMSPLQRIDSLRSPVQNFEQYVGPDRAPAVLAGIVRILENQIAALEILQALKDHR